MASRFVVKRFHTDSTSDVGLRRMPAPERTLSTDTISSTDPLHSATSLEDRTARELSVCKDKNNNECSKKSQPSSKRTKKTALVELVPWNGKKVCLKPASQRRCLAETSIFVEGLGSVPVVKGDPKLLPRRVLRFVAEKALLMRPRAIYICDGSIYERDEMVRKLADTGVLKHLSAYTNGFLARTSPEDTARVESRTFVTTRHRKQTEAITDRPSEVARWMSPETLSDELDSRFPYCMRGRMMYVLPFSMGPIGGPFSKYCVQLTDSPYVVLVTRIMARVSPAVFDCIGDDTFIKCVHSVGVPRPVTVPIPQNWPCQPSRLLIAHRMEQQEIWSFGSGYGGNSLLGKKCVALRLGSVLGQREGWLAEHMAIISITTPEGKEFFIGAGMPSGCGKTNLALMTPTLPGWKVQVLGDDIAWLRFDQDGCLRAMNPENGMFGIAAGSNERTNPGVLAALKKDFVVTNVAETADGHFYWQGLDEPKSEVTDWRNKTWKPATKTLPAHANSRFAVSCSQCPSIHNKWEHVKGVPLSAIIYCGRRPEGIPLVTESFSWNHGVFLASILRSEGTAASAGSSGSQLSHDPMGMRPFIGYNLADYFKHWISMNKPERKLPKIFHVNWYRRDATGQDFMWPGFGENIRVLDWILRRCSPNAPPTVQSAYGLHPVTEDFNLVGLKVDFEKLQAVSKKFLHDEAVESRAYYQAHLDKEAPAELLAELTKFEERITQMKN